MACSNRWVWLVLWAGVGACGLLGACQGGACTAMGCLGTSVRVDLLDEQGTPAPARGEFRETGSDLALPFDCHSDPDASASDLNCTDGTVHLDAFIVTRDMALEARFELENGAYSEWHPVELQITERVVKDFNGPGCDTVPKPPHPPSRSPAMLS